ERKPRSPEAAPLERGERLQFNPLYTPKAPPTLPPHLLAPRLCVQEELHSRGRWLALQPRGKARRKSWGDGRSVPPSQPAGAVCDHCCSPLWGRRLMSFLLPGIRGCGSATTGCFNACRNPKLSFLLLVSVQELCGERNRRLHPPPPSVHLQATGCVARELGEREKERHREKDREEREREKGEREKEKEREREMKEKGRKR
ncbi:hypothetical protein E2320_016414, partial [Naja naja]